MPSGDVAERALDALILALEKRKCAATDKPRRSRRTPDSGPRYVPADVKRAVWERDGRQCTFVGDTGHRCTARKFLELDHIEEVARGGYATVDRIRLRCRAHNQFTAEQTFGAEFMRQRRRAAAETAAADRGSPDLVLNPASHRARGVS